MRRIVLLMIAAVFLFAGTANAAEMKIAFVNMSQIAFESDAFKQEQKRMKSKYDAEQKSLEKAEKDLTKRFDDFKNKQAGLTPEARENAQLELIRQKRDFDDKAAAFRRKIASDENQVQEKIVKLVLVSASIYGKRTGLTMLMDSNTSGAIFIDKGLDVTQDVLKEVNKVWKEQPKELKDALASSNVSLTN